MTSDPDDKSTLDATIRMCGLFEAELLAWLMLSHWKHPRAGDEDFAKHLVEAAAVVLDQSRGGERFFEDIDPSDMNFVAAVWYAESCDLEGSYGNDVEGRSAWLDRVRHALPACFCNPDDLLY